MEIKEEKDNLLKQVKKQNNNIVNQHIGLYNILKGEIKSIEEEINNIKELENQKEKETNEENETSKFSSDENDFPLLEQYNKQIEFLSDNIEKIIIEVYNNNLSKKKKLNYSSEIQNVKI